MDDLFSTIIYLLPIAAVIFFRVFAANKKAKAAKEKRALQSEALRRAAEGIGRTAKAEVLGEPLSRVSGRAPEEWEPHWISEDEEEEEAVPDARPSYPVPPPSAGRVEPSVDPGRVQAPAAAGPQAFPLSGGGPSLLSPADLSTAEAASAARTARDISPFPASVERLSPLKKALVLMEVLGKPKAL